MADKATWQPVLAEMPIDDVWGIGRQYAAKLRAIGVDTALKFSALPDSWLRREMSVVGLRTAQELRGESCIALELVPSVKKGITVSRCFGQRITKVDQLCEATSFYAARAGEKLRRDKLLAKHMYVFMNTSPHAVDKVKDPYHAPSMSFELPYHTSYSPALIHYATTAVRKMFKSGHRYMKSGVILSDIVGEGGDNLDLFDQRDMTSENSLMAALDKINSKMGSRTVFYAGSGIKRPWAGLFNKKSQHFTTDWRSLPVVKD